MSRTAIFRQLVSDHMHAAPLVVDAATASREVVARMAESGVTAAVVTGGDGRIRGIITEQDVTRRLAFRATPETPAGDVMTGPVMTIAADDFLYHAIARMRRFRLRHMPVVDEAGAVAGMLNLDAALAVAAGDQIGQIDSLTQEGTLDGLREVKAAEVALAEELFADDVPAPEIQSVLTHVNRDIHRRILDANLAAMKEEGMGDPPVEFAFIIMGSGGRGESYVYPDQDNGLILDDYPDDEHDRVDGWFTELADRLATDLDTVGFPRCKGHVMAINPVWRKSISQWRAQIAGWCRRRSTVALRLADIFFDFRPICGARDLAGNLRDYVTELMPANPVMLQELQYDDEDAGVGLGWFNRFITEKHDEDHLGKLNLKTTGTLPLVQATRLLALREGIPATSTLARLEALYGNGTIDGDLYDYLQGAFRHIATLLLRQQIADFNAGNEVSNYVHPKGLSKRERDMLVDSLQAIRRLRQQVRAEFTGEIL